MKDDELPERLHELFCGKKTFKRGPRKGVTEYRGIIYRENDQFFDFTKQTRRPKTIREEILKEIAHGGKNGQGYFDACRIL